MKRVSIASVALLAVAGLSAGCKCPPVKDPGPAPRMVAATPAPAPRPVVVAQPAPPPAREAVVVREREVRPARRRVVARRERVEREECGWWAACYRSEELRDMGRLRDDWPSGPCCAYHATCR